MEEKDKPKEKKSSSDKDLPEKYFIAKLFESEMNRILDEKKRELEKKNDEDRAWVKQWRNVIGALLLILVFTGFKLNSWYKSKVEEFKENTEIILQNQADNLSKNLSAKLDLVNIKVQEKIDEEFQEKNIKNTIDASAKYFVENVGRKYIEGRVNDAVEPFKTEMNNIIENALMETEKLSNMFDIFILANEAKVGSRKAFKQLEAYESDTTILGRIAYVSYLNIYLDLEMYAQIPSPYKKLSVLKGDEQIPFGNLSTDEILERMESQAMTHEKRNYCMVYLQDKPQIELYEQGLRILKNSDSLPTCAAICGVIKELSGNELYFLDFDGWIKICEENLAKIEAEGK